MHTDPNPDLQNPKRLAGGDHRREAGQRSSSDAHILPRGRARIADRQREDLGPSLGGGYVHVARQEAGEIYKQAPAEQGSDFAG